jgi:hypothetical protein
MPESNARSETGGTIKDRHAGLLLYAALTGLVLLSLVSQLVASVCTTPAPTALVASPIGGIVHPHQAASSQDFRGFNTSRISVTTLRDGSLSI